VVEGIKQKRVYCGAVWIFLMIVTVSICFADEQDEKAAHFYFIQITDTHWGPVDHYGRTQKVVEKINKLPMPIKCVVHTGDIVMDNLEDPFVISKGIDILNQLKVPVYFIPGNHDILRNRYEMTQKAYTKHFGGLITEAEYEGVVFILIYTEPLTRFFPSVAFQPLIELSNALDRSRGKPVIVFHHSPSVEDFYNNAMHSRWKDDLRQQWAALINGHNVKAVVAGHFHRDEFHWLGKVPLYVSSSVAGYWNRQATFRIYEYDNGKLAYRTQYIDNDQQ